MTAEPAAPRGEMTVRRLLDSDPCPCRSGKPFSECCRGPLKEGLTPANTLHLLFEERDMAGPEVCGQCKLLPPEGSGERIPVSTCATCGHCTCEKCAASRQSRERLSFYAFMSQKMNGEVPAEAIVENISKRLWSPPVLRALDRLTWYALGSKNPNLRLEMTGAARKGLVDPQGRPL